METKIESNGNRLAYLDKTLTVWIFYDVAAIQIVFFQTFGDNGHFRRICSQLHQFGQQLIQIGIQVFDEIFVR